MPGFHQTLFTVSLAGLSWYGMLALHELGHVLGAVFTGATVERVILHPLTISSTTVSPNPHPAVVVWLGPVAGCLFPLVAWWTVPHRWKVLRNVSCFFVGFCLISNGLYIGIGSVQGVGDCREMLRTGTPVWLMMVFGLITVPAGLWLWHRLGSATHFLRTPGMVSPQLTYFSLAALLLGVAIAALVADSDTTDPPEADGQISAVGIPLHPGRAVADWDYYPIH